MVHLVDLEKDLLDNVVADQLEVRFSNKMRDVVFRAREEVIEADDVVSTLDQVGAEVGSHESGTARDDHAVGLDTGLGLDESLGLFFGSGGGAKEERRSRSRLRKKEKKARLLNCQ